MYSQYVRNFFFFFFFWLLLKIWCSFKVDSNKVCCILCGDDLYTQMTFAVKGSMVVVIKIFVGMPDNDVGTFQVRRFSLKIERLSLWSGLIRYETLHLQIWLPSPFVGAMKKKQHIHSWLCKPALVHPFCYCVRILDHFCPANSKTTLLDLMQEFFARTFKSLMYGMLVESKI